MEVNAQAAGNALDMTLRDFVSGQKVFRRYTLKRVLGRGGMGIVWLARDDELERDVALKFLPELIILDRGLLANLKRETKRNLDLTHKNIVRIYDFVNDEASGCISMEYIDGDTLSNMRADRQHKVFETHELAEWTKQLCDALDYAHNHVRVVHRDLKPSNLMVNKRGELKVADFGIARSLGDSMSMLTMGARGTSGTLVYMSPQQLDGERGSHLDDVYSFGATVYELLTTKPPFYSGNIDRQIHERIPPPMSHRREELEVEGGPIDETWEKLIAACLQKDPALRPQAIKEIAERLTVPLPQTRTRWLPFASARKTRPSPPKTYQPIDAPRPKRESKKRLRRAAFAVLVAGKAILRGVGDGVSAVKDDFHNAGLFMIAAGKAIVRGTAITVLPALAVATGVWYFAIRPPPKKIVKQPVPEIQLRQTPKVQPSVASIETDLAKVSPIPQPAAQNLAESIPSPTGEGSLSVDTTPAGATVIVDGSIIKTSPTTLSNLAAGKHQLQIVLQGYVTGEKEVEVKEGKMTSLGVITLHARTHPQTAEQVQAEQEMLNQQAQKIKEQKAATARKPIRNKPSTAPPIEKSTPSVARQPAAPPPPTLPAKTVSKPAPPPKTNTEPPRKPDRPFGESAPGG